MNFLEQLAAEWYEYNGYLVRTNIRYGETGHGGHIGEMDVIAYKPQSAEFIHIEASADAYGWVRRREKFQEKFSNAAKYYEAFFPWEKKTIRKIAIVGYAKARDSRHMVFGLNIETKLVPDFVADIAKELSHLDPYRVGIHEAVFPLLRAIQYGTYYLGKKQDKRDTPLSH